MAEVTITQPAHPIMNQGPEDAMGAELYRSRPTMISAPEPNPEFTFPMLPPLDSKTSGSEQDKTSRRLANRSRQLQISTSPLPQFSFPSGPDSTPPTGESIEVSPTRSIPSGRTGGHKRGGSEFIGGDGLLGGPGLMSSSPTKGHGALPSPPVSGRRRGHAHRRSGAISNHDLSSILTPPPTIDGSSRRTGSAPTTPCDPNAHRQFIPSLDRAASQPTLHQPKSPSSLEAPSESPRDSSPATVQSRPRVGFSDTLEFIPRPLSTISTGTSSSLSTVRPSHSLTGSINSIRSGTSSPPSAKKNRLSIELGREQIGDIRPKTADSAFNHLPSSNPFRRQITPPYRPSSASGSKLLKAQLNGHTTQNQLSSNMTIDSENANQAFGNGNEDPKPQFYADLQKLRSVQDGRPAPHLSRPRSSPEVKVSKRQRKVKSWAGSLLSRKSKNRSDDEEVDDAQISSAPIRDFAPLEGFSLDDVNFDEDTTCVIHSPGYEPRPSQANKITPLKPNHDVDTDITGVLDLDATWDSLDASSPTSSSGFSSAKRRMHSGGTTGGFIGPGMHYHRRAESAPNLLPVDYHAFGFPRLGSCPQMADVFEEEEEDDSKHTKNGNSSSGRGDKDKKELAGLGVKIVDVDNASSKTPPQRTPRQKRSKEGAIQKPSPVMDRKPSSISDSVADQNMMAEVPIEIVDAVEEPRFSVVTKSSDESTITPTITSAQLTNSAPPISLDFAGVSPAQNSEMTDISSSNPSPDFGNSSFDAPRLGTAHSSITDRSVWSSARTGESGPDTTYSVEDVPSLTSSASTMISGGLVPFSPASTRPSAERSFSFSAAVPRRTRPASAGGKRSSLASLSRLVASSYGEKSKLSIESRAQQDESEKSDKKKRHRISRMMKFWKSKEKLNG